MNRSMSHVPGNSVSNSRGFSNPVYGIPVAEVRQQYERRGLSQLSDVELVSAVGEVLSVPRQAPADSFVLHSPLELHARASLLPMVGPDGRELARLHIVALAAQYEAAGPGIDEPAPASSERPAVRPTEARANLLAAIAEGDLAQVDRAAVAVAADPGHGLPAAMIDAVAPLTAAAAHAPIYLYHRARSGRRWALSAGLLRPLARELARQPAWRVRWVDDRAPGAPAVEDRATQAARVDELLRSTPILGAPGSTFIHPLLMQVDESTELTHRLADGLGSYAPAVARSVLRVAAHSMLTEPPDHGPYGWSHALTIPQAVLGLAPLSAEPDRLLAIAATQLTAFRAAEGIDVLPPLELSHHSAPTPSALATAAATSHDAHVVKYGLACLDAAADDPDAAQLFLAAGGRLLQIWRDLGGDPTDPLA